jgi:indoleamine 2,3-dioxygenase
MIHRSSALNPEQFASYRVDPVRGFLPVQDPLDHLPPAYEEWDRLGEDVSALLMTGQVRRRLEKLTPLDVENLQDDRQRERAMLLLSVFANAYVWADSKPATRIPRGVAVPLCVLAQQLGLPPITTYPSIVLYNWRRLDPAGAIDLQNLASLQLFLGGIDEQWFYLVSVAIEAKGAAALPAIVHAQQAVLADDMESVHSNLHTVVHALEGMIATLMRMPEHCDPYVFYHRIRPVLTGWDEPGVIYEGISDRPQKFYGGSAAQSPLVQSLDAALGVKHADRETRFYLLEMRRYMLSKHRQFIEALEGGPSIREYVLRHKQICPELVEEYNRGIQGVEEFRRRHFEIAVHYITHQAPPGAEAKGTGGTNFSAFLGKSLKETREHLIDPHKKP